MSRLIFPCALLALILAGCNRPAATENTPSAAIDPKKYYAVLLSNGSVYFGLVEGLGTPYTVIKDVYYVQSNVNQETKAVSNALVKRGKEWHGPDRMTINEKAIVFLEPVGKDSRVSQLIEESKKSGATQRYTGAVAVPAVVDSTAAPTLIDFQS